MKSLLLNAEDALMVDESFIGGKAKNLAQLSSQGFPVPQWWVITTSAFKQQVETLKQDGWLDSQLEQLKAKDIDNATIERVAQSIQQAIKSTPLLDSVKHAIRESLPEDIRLETSLAIRSSVVGEDAEGASFAGQMNS